MNMNKIELHQQAIDLLEAIELYKRRIDSYNSLMRGYMIYGLADLARRNAHELDISRMVIERLRERYQITLNNLNKNE